MNQKGFEKLAREIGFQLVDLLPLIESPLGNDSDEGYNRFEKAVDGCLTSLEKRTESVRTPREYFIGEPSYRRRKVSRSEVLLGLYNIVEGQNVLSDEYGNKIRAISWFRRFYGIGQSSETKESIAESEKISAGRVGNKINVVADYLRMHMKREIWYRTLGE